MSKVYYAECWEQPLLSRKMFIDWNNLVTHVATTTTILFPTKGQHPNTPPILLATCCVDILRGLQPSKFLVTVVLLHLFASCCIVLWLLAIIHDAWGLMHCKEYDFDEAEEFFTGVDYPCCRDDFLTRFSLKGLSPTHWQWFLGKNKCQSTPDQDPAATGHSHSSNSQPQDAWWFPLLCVAYTLLLLLFIRYYNYHWWVKYTCQDAVQMVTYSVFAWRIHAVASLGFTCLSLAALTQKGEKHDTAAGRFVSCRRISNEIRSLFLDGTCVLHYRATSCCCL
jgi:hypothetical protein